MNLFVLHIHVLCSMDIFYLQTFFMIEVTFLLLIELHDPDGLYTCINL